MIAGRGRSTLVLVHRTPLLEQWITQLAMFRGIHEYQIGSIGRGKREPNGVLDVAMLQSLVRASGSGEALEATLGAYGHVVVDECHHLPAISFERALAAAPARYFLGLTATPERRDGHQPITTMQLGPVRYRIDPRALAASRPFAHRLIARETPFRPPHVTGESEIEPSLAALQSQLAADIARNDRIVDNVIATLEEGRSPIVLTQRRKQLELLRDRLTPAARHVIALHGGISAYPCTAQSHFLQSNLHATSCIIEL